MGWWVVACRIIVSAPVPVPFLWTLNLGFGTWIWDLDLGLDLGLTIDKSANEIIFTVSSKVFPIFPAKNQFNFKILVSICLPIFWDLQPHPIQAQDFLP